MSIMSFIIVEINLYCSILTVIIIILEYILNVNHKYGEKYGNLNNIHANTDSVIECITQWYFKGIEMGIISKEKEA